VSKGTISSIARFLTGLLSFGDHRKGLEVYDYVVDRNAPAKKEPVLIRRVPKPSPNPTPNPTPNPRKPLRTEWSMLMIGDYYESQKHTLGK
jgi:hypothetical protein